MLDFFRRRLRWRVRQFAGSVFLVVVLPACTYLAVEQTKRCEKRTKSHTEERAACLQELDLVEAVKIDVEAAGALVEAVKPEPETKPSTLWRESEVFCKEPEQKVCTYAGGCFCEEAGD